MLNFSVWLLIRRPGARSENRAHFSPCSVDDLGAWLTEQRAQLTDKIQLKLTNFRLA